MRDNHKGVIMSRQKSEVEGESRVQVGGDAPQADLEPSEGSEHDTFVPVDISDTAAAVVHRPPTVPYASPSRETMEAFRSAAAGVSVPRQGRFSRAELAQLETGLRTVCRELGLADDAEGVARLVSDPRGAQRDGRVAGERRDELAPVAVWSRVSEFVPGRTRRQVYDTARRRYALNNYKGEWSAEELDALQQAVQRYGPRWSTVADHVGRHAGACRDKWRRAFLKRNIKHGRWTPEERQRLAELVEEMGGTAAASRADEARREARRRRAGLLPDTANEQHSESTPAATGGSGDADEEATDTFWVRVAERLGTRSQFQCRSEWHRCLDPRRVQRDRSLHKTAPMDLEFLTQLEQLTWPPPEGLGVRDETEVNWAHVHPQWNSHRCYTWWKQLLNRLAPEYAERHKSADGDESSERPSFAQMVRTVRQQLVKYVPSAAAATTAEGHRA
ncbi:hypothetical protein CDCA_CDCA05G1689 [Cyanidium caldarium]|uniref:Uncharacterized protein n=1 Tax=Cyanidium caldarium TaxID=2771 RepID=A0AAV9ITP6_CYACA|nr:hypothetical protein CDCA_CDCA05G1689 [Cyanidium caldarium]